MQLVLAKLGYAMRSGDRDPTLDERGGTDIAAIADVEEQLASCSIGVDIAGDSPIEVGARGRKRMVGRAIVLR
jgi:hypothetical protein